MKFSVPGKVLRSKSIKIGPSGRLSQYLASFIKTTGIKATL